MKTSCLYVNWIILKAAQKYHFLSFFQAYDISCIIGTNIQHGCITATSIQDDCIIATTLNIDKLNGASDKEITWISSEVTKAVNDSVIKKAQDYIQLGGHQLKNVVIEKL